MKIQDWFRTMTQFTAIVGALVAIASCFGTNGPGKISSRIAIDQSQVGQTYTGVEVTPRFWEFDKDNDRYDGSWLQSRQEIAKMLVEDAGVKRVRVELRSGVENPVDYFAPFLTSKLGYKGSWNHYYEKINDNEDPNVANPAGFQWTSFDYYVENFVIPLRNRLAARNEKLFVNLCFVDFDWTPRKGNVSFAASPEEYAEIVTLAATRLRDKYGIPIDSLEVVLEPNNGAGWTGQAIGKAILAAKARLATVGLHPLIVAPSASSASFTVNYLQDIAKVPGAAAAINTVSYHRYDGDKSADAALPAIRSAAAQLQADTAMLEWIPATVETFFKDMAFGGTSAWAAYGAAQKADSPADTRGGAIVWRDQSGNLALTPKWMRISAVTRELKVGAKAYFASTQLGKDMPLVFHNPDGSEIIAVFSPNGSVAEISGAADALYRVVIVNSQSAEVSTWLVKKNRDNKIVLKIPAQSVAVLRSST
ncbi:MAG: hypothetical protein U1E64_12160 [Sphingomonadaceae bacterium]